MRKSTWASFLVLATSGIAPLVSQQGCSETSESGNLGVRSIVFLKRAHTVTQPNGQTSINVAGGNGQVLDYERYVPGGSLNILSPPRPDGKLENLTKDFPEADFNGVDVSFDAKQLVFSMRKAESDHYHLYTAQVDADGSGNHEIHQLTAGDYDDINPVYIPGRKIAFVTNQMYTAMGTRADEYEHARAVTQLATVSVDGGDADRRLASQNLSHTVAPFVRSDGKIGYSRWEHLGPINDVKLLAANPDGTGMQAIAGQHNKTFTALFSVREIESNVMIGIATSRNRTIHAGALVRVDARNAADPTCLDPKANQAGHVCLDEEGAKFEILTPDVPTGNGPSPVGRYRTPSMLPDGRILASYAEGPVNDLAEGSLTPPDFGIYVYDQATQKNQLVYNTRDMWEVNPIAVVSRKEPPVIADQIPQNQDTNLPVRIGSVNVAETSLGDQVTGAQFKGTPLRDALRQAAAVRVIEGFSSEGAPGVSMFGLTMDEGAAVLGEAKVEKDGSWLAEIPPYVPVHLQPLDKFGLSMRNQRLWIQGMPGEDRRCVGCHENRTTPKPRVGPTVAEQRQPEKFLAAIPDRTEYPWEGKVQEVLTAKCGNCHSGGDNDPFKGKTYTLTYTDPASGVSTPYTIPYLNLSADKLTVVYDRRAASYNTSYVSLFYPAAMDMGMGRTQVTGEVPPKWAIPTSARSSKLIEKVNVKAADGTFAFGSGVMHPEDKGVALTDEERQMLIRSIDIGGQYFARQGSTFTPNTNDPVKKY